MRDREYYEGKKKNHKTFYIDNEQRQDMIEILLDIRDLLKGMSRE